MHARWGEAPFVGLATCLLVGIVLASHLDRCLFAAMALAAGFSAAAALLAWRDRRGGPCLALALVTLVIDGGLLYRAERDGYPRTDVRALIARGVLPLNSSVLLEGCAAEDSTVRGPDLVTPVELHGVRLRETWVQTTGRVQLRLSSPEVPGARGRLAFGDRVRAWASCDVPRNFQNPGATDRVGFLARQGIHLLGRVKSPDLIEILPHDCGNAWDRAAASARRAVGSGIRELGDEGDPQRAAVLSSIVLGDYSGLSTDTRTEFQETGTIHVLVVSGLHVGWIVWAMSRLFQSLRLPNFVSRMLSIGGVFFYACLVGFQASISRAMWMFLLYLAGQSVFRRPNPANTLFACAFLLLSAHPSWLFDAGFQLSFLSVGAILLTAAPVIDHILRPMLNPLMHAGDSEKLHFQADRWQAFGRRLRFRTEIRAEGWADRFRPGFGRSLLCVARGAGVTVFAAGSMILISIAVQIWLEPVLAYYFNRLSWVAPLANLAVVPLSSLVLATGMAAGIGMSAASAARPLIHIAGACAGLLRALNTWFSTLPGAWQRCPTPPAWLPVTGILLLFAASFLFRRRWRVPLAFVIIEIAVLALGARDIPQRAARAAVEVADSLAGRKRPALLTITFLDVGQGDAAVIQFPDGRTWTIDAGGLWSSAVQEGDTNSFDTGEAIVSRFLWSRWIASLNRAVLTHPHNDHAGGMRALVRNFPIGCLYFSEAGNEPVQAAVLQAARAAEVPVRAVTAGENYNVGGVAIRVMSPQGIGIPLNLNDASIVLHLSFGRFSALLPGDLESTGEVGLAARESDLRSLLLKVGHHGSRTATSGAFLARVKPRWAVVSVGRNNPFHNPSPDTIARVRNSGARTLLTMDQGAVCFETDGINYRLSSYTHGLLEKGALPPVR